MTETAEKTQRTLQGTGADSAVGDKAQRILSGKVVSAKTAKTIAVEIERTLKHPRYGKYIRRTTRLLAHDEAGEAREGDTVTISPCAPVSRRKAWRLVTVVGRASAV